MPSSSYGPIISSYTVEQAVRDTLAAWIDTVLGEIERQSGSRWDLRQIRRPRSYFIQSEFHSLTEQHLPALHVEAAAKTVRHADGGRVDGQWPMIVQGVVKAKDRALSRELLGIYEAATSLILEKHGDLGIEASTVVQGASYDLIPPDRDRTLTGFEIPIVISVDHIADRFGGPTDPDDPPPTDLPPTSPEDPAHTSTHVTVTTE